LTSSHACNTTYACIEGETLSLGFNLSTAKSQQPLPRRSRPQARKLAQNPGPQIRQPAKDAASVAEYIADMTGELARLAGAARLDTLTYFLNMARMEAESHIGPRL
jgi:hypothetical protein